MSHFQRFTEIIAAELKAALAEQREPNYQQVFMQQLQTQNLNDEHWLALLLQLLAISTTTYSVNQFQAFYHAEVDRKAAESLAQFRQASHEQANDLRQVADLAQHLSPEALSLIKSL